MPFLVRPPPEFADASDYSLTYTIIGPDANDRTILRDLQHWGWLVSQHEFDDEDFIRALRGVEKDTRQSRRHAYAMAGKVLDCYDKPTLDELWELEARRMLEDTAYDEESNGAFNSEHSPSFEGREESVDLNAEQEEDPRLQMAVKTWLKHIDRTRQTNGFLDYDDPQHEQPRLLTRGLDHSPTDAAYNPAYAVYADLKRTQDKSLSDLNNEHVKSKTVSQYIEKSKNVLQRLSRPEPASIDLSGMGIVAGAPFAWTMYSQLHAYSRPYSQVRTPSLVSRRKPQWKAIARKKKDKARKPSTQSLDGTAGPESATLDNDSVSQPHTLPSHLSAHPSYASTHPPLHNKPLPNLPVHHHPLPSANSSLSLHDYPSSDLTSDLNYPLIFPGTISSTRTYIQQMRPGIQSPPVTSHLTQSDHIVSPPLHRPGLGPDPWGWDEWDRQMQRDAERERYNFPNADGDRDRDAGVKSREDFCASLKFCVARRRMSLRAREGKRMKARVRKADGRVARAEEVGRRQWVDGNRNERINGYGDVDLRVLAREMDEIGARMG